jgi:PAS domain S-box-containing protein
LRKTSDRFSYQAIYGSYIRGAIEQKHKDLQLANQALLDSNRFLRTVLNTSPDLVLYADQDDRIILFNHGAEILTGWTEEKIKGKILDTLLPSQLINNLKQILLEQDQIINLETKIHHHSGNTLPINLSVASMYSEGKRVGAVFTGQDMTEKKQLEEQLMESEKLALLGQLAGEIVHEIRNPVNNMMMGTSFLRHNFLGSLGDNVDNVIQSLDVQIDRISQIIKNILLFSSPAEEEKEQVPLHQLIETAIRFSQPEKGDRLVNFEIVNIDKELQIFANHHQFLQVFINLFNNALQHMKNEGTIFITGHSEENDYQISVEDTGGGISEEELPHIFKPFFTTRKTTGGSGLGLTICRKIIESNGGFVTASNGKTGARFTITFPDILENTK